MTTVVVPSSLVVPCTCTGSQIEIEWLQRSSDGDGARQRPVPPTQTHIFNNNSAIIHNFDGGRNRNIRNLFLPRVIQWEININFRIGEEETENARLRASEFIAPPRLRTTEVSENKICNNVENFTCSDIRPCLLPDYKTNERNGDEKNARANNRIIFFVSFRHSMAASSRYSDGKSVSPAHWLTGRHCAQLK